MSEGIQIMAGPAPRPSELLKDFVRLSVDEIRAELAQTRAVREEAIARAKQRARDAAAEQKRLAKEAVAACKAEERMLEMLLRAKGVKPSANGNGSPPTKEETEARVQRIADYLGEHGPQKNADLARALGLKPVVVHGVCARRPALFLKDDQARWTGKPASSSTTRPAGRKARKAK